jgi:hypothetical protein
MREPIMGHRSISSTPLPLFADSVLDPPPSVEPDHGPVDLDGGVRFTRGFFLAALLSVPFWIAILWLSL